MVCAETKGTVEIRCCGGCAPGEQRRLAIDRHRCAERKTPMANGRNDRAAHPGRRRGTGLLPGKGRRDLPRADGWARSVGNCRRENSSRWSSEAENYVLLTSGKEIQAASAEDRPIAVECRRDGQKTGNVRGPSGRVDPDRKRHHRLRSGDGRSSHQDRRNGRSSVRAIITVAIRPRPPRTS